MTSQAAQGLDERYERLPIEHIVASKTNPRTHFDETYLAELAGSIAEKGVVQPILVRQVDAGSHKPMKFEIVAGECRYRASKIAKQTHIPAVIRLYSDEQVLELQLIENIHRKDLTALEQAAGYRALITSNPDKHSAASIAQRIGMSEAWVWDRLKLNDLIPDAKAILEQELMTVGHAILIARLKPEDQKRTVRVDSMNGYGNSREGLWQFNGGRFDLGKDHPEAGAGKYANVKAVSVRELEAWIRDHIRFDVAHAAKAAPLVFEETAARVSEAEAKEGRGRKVVSITLDHMCPSHAVATGDERTYGNTAWKKAEGKDGEPTCEHAVLGVVVAGGRNYGQTFHVCVARDKCRTHWGEVVKAKEKSAKLRESGKGKQATQRDDAAQRREEQKNAKQQAARERWRRIGSAIEDAVTAKLDKVAKVTPALLNLALNELRLPKTTPNKLAAMLVEQAMDEVNWSWDGSEKDARAWAKALGIDVKAIEKKIDEAAAPAKASGKKANAA